MMFINAFATEADITYEAIFIPISEGSGGSVRRIPMKNGNEFARMDMNNGRNVQKI